MNSLRIIYIEKSEKKKIYVVNFFFQQYLLIFVNKILFASPKIDELGIDTNISSF